ncbi:hypothetical protein GWK48_00535 [Metallosphaera tengchongensis]|uniref:Uncharacterized protein n=1 Tax=Metallosphaera tengchongensis TaxID=1532350 RepID=A0A6N0NT49_9CREN|nr:archaellin/type IV pilin N-terminal domain-containing protein [Metallosphaera tengchongensis]QKQ99082.1 hypothetical protein GWK48_00535 [Metallosphaera tengchongensis]
MRKGISNAIALLILIVVVLVIAVPALLYVSNSQQAATTQSALVNNYIYLKSLQVKQVQEGHPAIFYANSSILFYYTNGTFVPPTNLTITHILFLNGSIWQNVTQIHYPLEVSRFFNLSLPGYVQGHPIIIVTSLGNVFFLTPKSSIGPYSLSSKGGFTVVTQIYGSPPLSVSTNISTNIYGKFENFTTPVSFPNYTGTFVVKAPQYVFYERPNGSVVTGVFRNWIVLGTASLNSTNSTDVRVTLEGTSTVLEANYTPVTKIITISLKVHPSTNNICVLVDGRPYNFDNTINVTVPAGYINVSLKTLQFNYSGSNQNIIYHYSYDYSSFGSNKYDVTSFILFSLSNSSLNINYINNFNYVKIYIGYSVYNNGYMPNVTAIYYVKGFIGDYIIPGRQVYPLSPSSDVLFLNSSLYNYNEYYWVVNGTYSIGGTGNVLRGPFLVIYNNSNLQLFNNISWNPYIFLVNGTKSNNLVVTINDFTNITVEYVYEYGYDQF